MSWTGVVVEAALIALAAFCAYLVWKPEGYVMGTPDGKGGWC